MLRLITLRIINPFVQFELNPPRSYLDNAKLAEKQEPLLPFHEQMVLFSARLFGTVNQSRNQMSLFFWDKAHLDSGCYTHDMCKASGRVVATGKRGGAGDRKSVV